MELAQLLPELWKRQGTSLVLPKPVVPKLATGFPKKELKGIIRTFPNFKIDSILAILGVFAPSLGVLAI